MVAPLLIPWAKASTATRSAQYGLRFDTPTRAGQIVIDGYTNHWFQIYDRTFQLPFKAATDTSGTGFSPSPLYSKPRWSQQPVFMPAQLVAPGALLETINCSGLTIIGAVENPTLLPESANDVDISFGHRFSIVGSQLPGVPLHKWQVSTDQTFGKKHRRSLDPILSRNE